MKTKKNFFLWILPAENLALVDAVVVEVDEEKARHGSGELAGIVKRAGVERERLVRTVLGVEASDKVVHCNLDFRRCLCSGESNLFANRKGKKFMGLFVRGMWDPSTSMSASSSPAMSNAPAKK